MHIITDCGSFARMRSYYVGLVGHTQIDLTCEGNKLTRFHGLKCANTRETCSVHCTALGKSDLRIHRNRLINISRIHRRKFTNQIYTCYSLLPHFPSVNWLICKKMWTRSLHFWEEQKEKAIDVLRAVLKGASSLGGLGRGCVCRSGWLGRCAVRVAHSVFKHRGNLPNSRTPRGVERFVNRWKATSFTGGEVNSLGECRKHTSKIDNLLPVSDKQCPPIPPWGGQPLANLRLYGSCV